MSTNKPELIGKQNSATHDIPFRRGEVFVICDPLQENRPLLISSKCSRGLCKVSRVENGVCNQIFFLFNILIFIPLAIYGPNFITCKHVLRGKHAAQSKATISFYFS